MSCLFLIFDAYALTILYETYKVVIHRIVILKRPVFQYSNTKRVLITKN